MIAGEALLQDGDAIGPSDRARVWRVPQLDNLDCMAAQFETYEFSMHAHDSYGVAVILDGATAFRWRGESHIAPAGSVYVMNPGEPHDGKPAVSRFVYRTFYPSVALIRRLAAELCDGAPFDPLFASTVIHDQPLARRIAEMHRVLESSAGTLARESAFVETIVWLLQRHAGLEDASAGPGREANLVERLREYIDAHFADDVSLDDLAHQAGRTRYSVLRAFRRHTGMTPHAYLLNRRVEHARRSLASGRPLAETAFDCGFFDQSHFTRVFKRHTGVTPGRYRDAANIGEGI